MHNDTTTGGVCGTVYTNRGSYSQALCSSNSASRSRGFWSNPPYRSAAPERRSAIYFVEDAGAPPPPVSLVPLPMLARNPNVRR